MKYPRFFQSAEDDDNGLIFFQDLDLMPPYPHPSTGSLETVRIRPMFEVVEDHDEDERYCGYCTSLAVPRMHNVKPTWSKLSDDPEMSKRAHP